MLKHITQIIWNERRHNIGVWLELFLVSLFLWYIVDYVTFFVSKYNEPLGFDTEHTYIMDLGVLNSKSAEFVQEDSTVSKAEQLYTILDRIKLNPMIEAASLSFFSSPHIGGNMWTPLYRDSVKLEGKLLKRMVTPDFFRVFQYKSINGSTDELVKAIEKGEFVISSEIDEELFPKESAVGKEIKMHGDDYLYTVGAVSTRIRYDNFNDWNSKYFAMPLDANWLESFFIRGRINFLEVCVRVKPDEDYEFIDRFREQMSEQFRVGNFYLNTIKYIPANKDRFQRGIKNNLKTRGFVAFFLLINIFLGITGTFWFRTQYRRNEIGVRIAMGETRKGLLKMFYTEGLLLLTFAMVPAMLLFAFITNAEILVESSALTIGRYFIGFGITYLLLALMILFGIWFPARKAIKISPADALRDE
ncbi:MAG: FtsX-like permease family protein [Dysgonamonadaceae bacterium]|nr:FtsX-like permease family protein [Dysgonamonadaceae bacterium]